MSMSTDSAFGRLDDFLDRLKEVRLHFTLARISSEAILVEVYVPGEHWEVEFFLDGHIEVERFRSNGHIDDESSLTELFEAEGEEDRRSL